LKESALKEFALKGHGFSRAATGTENTGL